MKWLFRWKRVLLLLLLPVGYALLYFASGNVQFAQWYCDVIYPQLSLGINHVTSLLPFSIAESLVFFLVAVCLVYPVYFIVRFIRYKNERKKTVLKFIINPVCVASLVYFLYVMTCGINYYRPSFAQENFMVVTSSSKSQLIDLCKELCGQANTLRGQVNTDENSVMKLSSADISLTCEEARNAYNRLDGEYKTLMSGYGVPKPVLNSRLMSYSNITGIFFPFTFEANVNVDIPDYSIPVTMCHELTHLRGYMQEEEANFVAYLACEKSSSVDFQYSGTMLACIYAGNALYSVDQNAYNQIYGQLSDGVKRDLNENHAYWKQFEGPIAEVSDKVNDSYLKANGQEDGVKSYGRVVDLLLADYRARHQLDGSI